MYTFFITRFSFSKLAKTQPNILSDGTITCEEEGGPISRRMDEPARGEGRLPSDIDIHTPHSLCLCEANSGHTQEYTPHTHHLAISDELHEPITIVTTDE